MGIAGNARLSVDANAAMPSLTWVGQLVDEGIEADGRLSAQEARGRGAIRAPYGKGLKPVDEGVADAGGVLDAGLGRRKVVAPGTDVAGGRRRLTARGAGDLRAGERQARIGYRSEHAAILSRPDCYD